MDQYHPTESENWRYRQQQVINRHLYPTLGGMYARELRQVHLQSIISNLAKQGYATGTMKKIKQTAVRIMQVAVESDLIVKNPFSGTKVPYVEPEERRALTESEIALITENWRGVRMGLAAMIKLYVGLRIGEVLALEWTDIDFNERTITVSKSRTVLKNKPSLKTPKTKAGFRVIPIPEILYDVLFSAEKERTGMS